MPSEQVQRYVNAHLRWRDATGPEKDRLLKDVLAARGVLKGREFAEAAGLIAQANGRPTVQYTHNKTEEQMATETAAVEVPSKPKAAATNGSIISSDLRSQYEKSNVKTASGARSISNGDAVAKALNGLTVEQLEKVAKRAEVGDRFTGWGKLNPGMQRMNLGNVLRAQVKAGDAKAKATVAEAAKMERETVQTAKAKKKAAAA